MSLHKLNLILDITKSRNHHSKLIYGRFCRKIFLSTTFYKKVIPKEMVTYGTNFSKGELTRKRITQRAYKRSKLFK